MGPVQAAIRSRLHAGQRFLTPTGRGEFVLDRINDDGIVLRPGEQEAWTPLRWECLEGVVPSLAGDGWAPIGGRYGTDP